MSDSNSICFICLHRNDGLEKVTISDIHNVNNVTEVKFVLPELAVLLDPEIPAYHCCSCRTTLHAFYTFKKKCLENYTRLIRNSKIYNNKQIINEKQNVANMEVQITHNYKSSSPLPKEPDVRKTGTEDNIVVKEEIVSEDNVEDRQYYQQQLEFVKCETVSDNEQDGGSSSEDDQLKDETHMNYQDDSLSLAIMAPEKNKGKRKTKNSDTEKKKRKTWDEEAMRQAIENVKSKTMGYKKAAIHFSVPCSTLFRLSQKDGSVDTVVRTKLGRPFLISEELEKELVEHILLMEKNLFGVTRRDIQSLAFQLAKRHNLPNSFSLLEEKAGRDWLRCFLNRHIDTLQLKKPLETSLGQTIGFTKANVDQFFDYLEDQMANFNYPADRVYNVDETGLYISKNEVFSIKGKRQIEALTTTEKECLFTAILCMNASGTFIPPLLIFPQLNTNEGAPPGTVTTFHPSGWVDTQIFTQWFEHFIEKVKPTTEDPVLLILDGNYTHTRNINVIILAKQNNVNLLCLPPLTNHRMQPMQKTVMGALKTCYTNEVLAFLRSKNRPVSSCDVSEIFGKAYLQVQTSAMADEGFASTGIFPVRRDVFTNEDYLSEEEKFPFKIEKRSEASVDGVQPSTSGVKRRSRIRFKHLKKTSERGRKCGK